MRRFSLKKRKASRKDFSHRKTLGAANIVIPPSGTIKSFAVPIENQGSLQDCTAETACEWKRSHTGNTYDVLAFWQAEKDLMGDQNSDGATLETQGATGVKMGWTKLGDTQPTEKMGAYVFVNNHPLFGPDAFDILRAAIMSQGGVSLGLDWMADWDFAVGGIIPHTFGQLLGGHDMFACGLNFINGVDYVDVQQSWGEGFGDSGIYHLDRYMINKIIGEYGALYWADGGITFQRMGLLESLLVNLKNLLMRLL